MGKSKSEKSRGIGAGIVAFGAAFALISSIFHPHSLFGYLISGGVSALIGIVAKIMGEGLDTSQKPSASRRVSETMEKVKADTGNAEADALLEKGREILKEIRTENDLIPDSVLSEKLDMLEEKCAEIFRTVYEKPAKAGQIRKFMDYYLPTTLKMVKGYRMLDERGISGVKVQEAKQGISDSLSVIIGGCDKMLANLYRDDVLDLTTDIDVLQQMLKRDGLTENDLNMAACQAMEAARIDAEVTRRAIERSKQSMQPNTRPDSHPAAQSRPAVQNGSGTYSSANGAAERSREYDPTVPTMDGGTYSVYETYPPQQKQ